MTCSPTLAAQSETSLPGVGGEQSHVDESPSHLSNSISESSPPQTQLQREVEEPNHVQHESFLANAVRSFGEKWAWKARTYLAVVCAIVSVSLDVYTELRYSCIVLVVVLDFGCLACVLLIQPTHETSSSPLNALAVLRLPFVFLPSTILKLFDVVCLFLWFVGLVLRDVLIMLFVMILLKSVYLYASN